METAQESPIIEKTIELCQTILAHPQFQEIRRRIDLFMADEEAKVQFRNVNEKGEYLHHKQEQGFPLGPEEIADFEKERQALLNNPLARDFLSAQEEMFKLQDSVGKYVAKTFELGRLPESEDLCCGNSGCGCH